MLTLLPFPFLKNYFLMGDDYAAKAVSGTSWREDRIFFLFNFVTNDPSVTYHLQGLIL